MAVFTLDGKEYKVGVTKIDREFELVEGDNTMMAKTGREIRDVRGTAYRFTVHIDMRIIAPEEYDALYWALSAPVDYHDVTFPFGQSTLSFRAGIESGEDTLKRNRQISRRIKKHLWLSNRSWARDVHSFGILHSWGALAGKSCSAQASSIWLIAGAFRRTQSK